MVLTYSHAPRPIAAPVTFTLAGDRLTVDTGRKVQEVRLGAVEQVRMSYEARGFARQAFQTRVRLKDGKSFVFSSVNWKSFVESERLDPAYRAFAQALLQAVAAANPDARFVAGRPGWIWAINLGLGVISFAAVTVFLWRAVMAGYTTAALFGAVFMAAGIWQLEPMIRLNKPRRFTPDSPPANLMP